MLDLTHNHDLEMTKPRIIHSKHITPDKSKEISGIITKIEPKVNPIMLKKV